MDENQILEQEKRENRRLRRKKSQRKAYLTMTLFLVVLVAATVLGIGLFRNMQQEELLHSQEKIDEMLGSEEALPTMEPMMGTPTPSPEETFDAQIEERIAAMTLEEKVAGLFIVTPEALTGVDAATQAGDKTKESLEKYPVGGIIYFQKNMKSESQLKELISKTVSYAKYPLFIAVDEEGGEVSRLAKAGLGPKVDSAAKIGTTGDADKAYQAGKTIGENMAKYGFNLNFAPVADISNVENSVMKDRAYGADAATASTYVTSMMLGLDEMGIVPCLKHFPGIGCTTQDTHDGMASTQRELHDFGANEFKVFQAGMEAGAQMIMVGHMSAPNLTGDEEPCVFSKKLITDILRKELKYNGVVISDALNMGAISTYYGSDEAAVMALKAGCDMLLMPESFEKAYAGVLAAILDGTISEERVNDSSKRVYRIKYQDY